MLRYQLMPLARAAEPFDHPDWLFELKYDGFRAFAYVNGGGTKLVSRCGLGYRHFDDLRSEVALEANVDDAVLNGEIVNLDNLLHRLHEAAGTVTFVAFDALAMNGRDVRKMALVR